MSGEVPVRIDRVHYERLQAIRERDGVPIAEQVRRALDAWLAEREQPAAKVARKRTRR